MTKYKELASGRVVEAFRFWVEQLPKWFVDSNPIMSKQTYKQEPLHKGRCVIEQNGEKLIVFGGDYIILLNGIIYSVPSEEFETLFEPIGEKQILMRGTLRHYEMLPNREVIEKVNTILAPYHMELDLPRL